MSLEEIIQNQMKRERLILLNDIHVPYHDRETLQAVKKGVKSLKPDILLLGGDVADFYNVSSFNKDPSREHNLYDEVTEVKEFLKDVSTNWNAKKVIYLNGNHEERLQRYIDNNAPDLHWVEGLKLENILDLDNFNIKFIKERYWTHKGVMYSHLNKSLKWGGASSKNLGIDYNIPVVHTHTHRVGHVRVGDRDFYDNGCLCKLEADFISGPVMWNQAFMIVDYLDGIPHFNQVNIVDHKFILNNKLYTPEGAVSLNVRRKRKK